MAEDRSIKRGGEPPVRAEDTRLPPSADNTCVLCGRIIPEGRLVCPRCEQGEDGPPPY
ncbi:MAG: hypothetical protein IJF73_06690 [Clostridia bacterium]|nr:hypothetical protein [Clostridia bacterium]